MHVLTGVSVAANARDTRVLVSTNVDESHGLAAYERVMRSRSADGVILTSSAVTDFNVERLAESGLPVVLIGNFPYLPQAVSVGVNDVAASRLITEHLIHTHGRSRLVHVTGPLDHQTGIDRRAGFCAALSDAGLDPHARVIEGDFSEDSGRVATEQLLESGAGFDGIVFANDDMAFGGLQVLSRAGLSVPGEVAVVGFDDFGLSRVTTPGITTMHVPAEQMAQMATERLFDLIDGDKGDHGTASHIELEVTFIARASCGCTQEGAEPIKNPIPTHSTNSTRQQQNSKKRNR